MLKLPPNVEVQVDSELPSQTIHCSVDQYRTLKTQMERQGYTVELNPKLSNEVLKVSQDVYDAVVSQE